MINRILLMSIRFPLKAPSDQTYFKVTSLNFEQPHVTIYWSDLSEKWGIIYKYTLSNGSITFGE